MVKCGLRLPQGFEDLGPDRRERVEALGTELATLFASWGYRRVEPPAVENYETFAAGSPSFSADRAYRFLDRDGRLLALRPDITTGVGRMIAQALREESGAVSLPLRLRYEGIVFRREPQGSARSHAFEQAGVELIGVAGPDADAEVIGLASAAANLAGLPEVRLLIGHSGLVKGAMQAAGRGSPDVEEQFRAALARRDLVAVSAMIGSELAGVLAGGPFDPVAGREALNRLAGAAEAQIAAGARELLALYDLLDEYATPEPWLEPVLLRDLDYYSGVVFELLSPAFPEPLAGGGRYDDLLGKFGAGAPATGFAINLTATSQAGPGQVLRPRQRVALAWADAAARSQALRIAHRLREQGSVAETLPEAANLTEALAAAASRPVDRLLFVSESGYREIRVSGDQPAGQAGLAGVAGIH